MIAGRLAPTHVNDRGRQKQPATIPLHSRILLHKLPTISGPKTRSNRKKRVSIEASTMLHQSDNQNHQSTTRVGDGSRSPSKTDCRRSSLNLQPSINHASGRRLQEIPAKTDWQHSSLNLQPSINHASGSDGYGRSLRRPNDKKRLTLRSRQRLNSSLDDPYASLR